MASSDLTTVAAVRDWAGVPSNNTTADPLLSRLVSSASKMVLGYLNRPAIFPRAYSERHNGTGNTKIFLHHWPVTAISTLSIDGIAIPSATAPGIGVTTQTGYLLEPWNGLTPGRPQALDLFNYAFNRGAQNIVATYTAGYQISAEAQAVPASGFTVPVSAFDGPWAADLGVTYANGTALTLVASAPAIGQYALVQDTPGTYQFAAADANAAVLISYAFIPSDIFQATTEIVGERYSYKGHVGVSSKSLGGQETTTFSLKDMTDAVKMMLQPYRRIMMF